MAAIFLQPSYASAGDILKKIWDLGSESEEDVSAPILERPMPNIGDFLTDPDTDATKLSVQSCSSSLGAERCSLRENTPSVSTSHVLADKSLFGLQPGDPKTVTCDTSYSHTILSSPRQKEAVAPAIKDLQGPITFPSHERSLVKQRAIPAISDFLTPRNIDVQKQLSSHRAAAIPVEPFKPGAMRVSCFPGTLSSPLLPEEPKTTAVEASFPITTAVEASLPQTTAVSQFSSSNFSHYSSTCHGSSTFVMGDNDVVETLLAELPAKTGFTQCHSDTKSMRTNCVKEVPAIERTSLQSLNLSDGDQLVSKSRPIEFPLHSRYEPNCLLPQKSKLSVHQHLASGFPSNQTLLSASTADHARLLSPNPIESANSSNCTADPSLSSPPLEQTQHFRCRVSLSLWTKPAKWANLAKLPFELLSLILDDLSDPDLLACRLVCRPLCSVATDKLKGHKLTLSKRTDLTDYDLDMVSLIEPIALEMSHVTGHVTMEGVRRFVQSCSDSIKVLKYVNCHFLSGLCSPLPLLYMLSSLWRGLEELELMLLQSPFSRDLFNDTLPHLSRLSRVVLSGSPQACRAAVRTLALHNHSLVYLGTPIHSLISGGSSGGGGGGGGGSERRVLGEVELFGSRLTGLHIRALPRPTLEWLGLLQSLLVSLDKLERLSLTASVELTACEVFLIMETVQTSKPGLLGVEVLQSKARS